MKRLAFLMICCIHFCITLQGQEAGSAQPLFTPNLSNADYDEGVWTVDNQGVLTATEDKMIWTRSEYENFELTLEFKNEACTNSGVVIYCPNKQLWVSDGIEIQIADDYCTRFRRWEPTWRCGAIFGHLAPSQLNVVKQPGEWNRMKITAKGKNIVVELNDIKVNDMDMNLWTSGTTNPDGSTIPEWMPKPFAELTTKGLIGLQGKHGEAAIHFRNIVIKQL